MNNEKRQEIIKALAYDMSDETILSSMDISISDLEEIKACKNEIEEKKAWLKEEGFIYE